MVVAWGWIFVGLLFVGAVGMILWLLSIIFKEEEKIADNPFIIDFSSFKDKRGRAIIEELNSEPCDSGRISIHVKPKDVDYRKLKDHHIEEYDILSEPNKIITFAKGTWSKDRTIKIRLPQYPENLPEEMKGNVFGKLLSTITEDKNYESMVVDLIRKGSERKTELLNKMPEGEVSEAIIDLYEGIIKQISEASKDKKTSSSFERPGFNSGAT
jgi:hypothetical protein